MYRLTSATEPCPIVRLSDGACIPPDTGNTDYREYLSWVAGGGVPYPCAPDPSWYAWDATNCAWVLDRAAARQSVSYVVSSRCDGIASSLGYDNILSAISYAGDQSHQDWQTEAIALRDWRGACYEAAIKYLDECALPTSSGMSAALPEFDLGGFSAYRSSVLRRADAISESDPAKAILLRQSVS